MKRNRTIETDSLKVLVIVIALGTVAHAGLPYLPQVGPPPLRVLTAKNANAAEIIRLANGTKPPATNTLADIEARALAMPTNQPAWAGITNSVSTAPLPAIGSSSDNPLSDARTASIFAMPTPDLLSITPQMLAAYFHPVVFGTNVNAFVGPYPVSFTPPLPPNPPPSRAEYIVK
jgi:hypothetical protein